MKSIDKADATDSLAAYTEHTADFPIVVTEHGKPIAALLPVPNADLETISLSTDPRFLSIISRSRSRQEREGGLSSKEMRQRLDQQG